MDLTDQGVSVIREWAKNARAPIETVRLFGSRGKGTAEPDSDVDLAITVGFAHYVALANEWVQDLSDKLGLPVHMKQYNPPEDGSAQRACAECSIVLFPLGLVSR